MGYLVADMDSIAPRQIAFTSLPPVPPFPAPIAEEVVNGYGQLPSGAIPYVYTGPAQTGGTEANYRTIGGGLEDHESSGPATGFPLSADNYQARPVWDGSYRSSDPTTTTARSAAPATLYTPAVESQINGSSNPPDLITGDTIAITSARPP